MSAGLRRRRRRVEVVSPGDMSPERTRHRAMRRARHSPKRHAASPVQCLVCVRLDGKGGLSVRLRGDEDERRLADEPRVLGPRVVPQRRDAGRRVGRLDLGDATDERDHHPADSRFDVDAVVLRHEVLPVPLAPLDHGREIRHAADEPVELPEEQDIELRGPVVEPLAQLLPLPRRNLRRRHVEIRGDADDAAPLLSGQESEVQLLPYRRRRVLRKNGQTDGQQGARSVRRE